MAILKDIDFEVPGFGELSDPPLAVPAYSNALLGFNPRAYWRFGETSGATLADETGNYPLSLTGNAALGEPGAIQADSDTAVRFNNGSAVSSIPVLPTGTGTPFSVAFWARVPQGIINGGPFIRQLVPGVVGRMQFFLYGDGRMHFYVAGEGNFFANAVLDTNWRMFVLTRDATGVIRWYADGRLDAEDTGHTTGIFPTTLNVGSVGNDPSDLYLDELSILNQALSPDEVRWLYGLGIGRLALPPAS
ncbi:MAG: LamG-like jellyroll fold domain-containing protein [Phycisphaeraceae bacterium]